MNRRPRTDNQLEFADSLQCLKHLSPEWIYSHVGLSVWIDRIDNLADDKLIEVDDLLEMSRVQAHRLGVEPKAIWRHRNGRIIAPRATQRTFPQPGSTAICRSVPYYWLFSTCGTHGHQQ